MKKWIEAMRLRTLPVSISGVLVAMGCMLLCGLFSMVPALLCLVFAVLAQIASNFANEYFDYRNGLDKKGREGFRRGVTEGDITPDAMKRATFITLALAAAVGCTMLLYGPWWLILVGVSVGIFALAYSAGPYPLSHHGLGDVAVIIFFGIVPVTLTCYLQAGGWYGWQISLPASVAVGLMAANVLVVNNYRDMEDDYAVNKRTTVVIFGRKTMAWFYLMAGNIAMVVMLPVWKELSIWAALPLAVYLILHLQTWRRMVRRRGSALNPVLGRTAMNLLVFSLLLIVAAGLSMIA